MSIDVISRALKYAKVPECKVVWILFPNPRIIVHVPQSHAATMAGVVAMLKPAVEMKVTLLESGDVRPGEALLVKVKGHIGKLIRNPGESSEAYAARKLASNRQVAIEYDSAVVQ